MNDAPRPAPSAGDSLPVLGRWTFDLATGLATYDDDLVEMYDADLTVPGDPADLQRHIHPDDVDEVRRTTARVVEHPGPVTGRYRFRTRSRGERIFVVAGDPVRTDGVVTAVAGFTIDVTESARDEANAAVEASREHRAAIEQVKGALMAAYALDDGAAFQVLRRASMDHNAKLADLARAVVARLQEPADRFHRERDLAVLQLVEETAAGLAALR